MEDFDDLEGDATDDASVISGEENTETDEDA